MRDLIRDVTSHCAWSCDVGQVSGKDKILIENPKREKMMKFLHEFKSRGWSRSTGWPKKVSHYQMIKKSY